MNIFDIYVYEYNCYKCLNLGYIFSLSVNTDFFLNNKLLSSRTRVFLTHLLKWKCTVGGREGELTTNACITAL